MTLLGEGGGFPIGLSVPLSMSTTSAVYSENAHVNVDRYIPGRCGWQFSGVSARVRKASIGSAENEFLISRPFLAATSPYLLQGYEADKRKGPVWRCKTAGPLNLPHQTAFLDCGGSKTESERPLIESETQTVMFSVIDGDKEQ